MMTLLTAGWRNGQRPCGGAAQVQERPRGGVMTELDGEICKGVPVAE